MAIFEEIEKRLENLIEGFFNAKFSSSLQPVELARKLAAELDRERQVSVAKVYVPNIFNIAMSPGDFAEFDGYHQSLASELKEYLVAYAREKDYRFTGEIELHIRPEPHLRSGAVEIACRLEEKHTETPGATQSITADEIRKEAARGQKAHLIEAASGIEYELGAITTIGRKSANDIVIDDQSVSRRHARVEAEGQIFRLVDLDSTNGTYVNGDKIRQTALADGDSVTIGTVDLEFGHHKSD